MDGNLLFQIDGLLTYTLKETVMAPTRVKEMGMSIPLFSSHIEQDAGGRGQVEMSDASLLLFECI